MGPQWVLGPQPQGATWLPSDTASQAALVVPQGAFVELLLYSRPALIGHPLFTRPQALGFADGRPVRPSVRPSGSAVAGGCRGRGAAAGLAGFGWSPGKLLGSGRGPGRFLAVSSREAKAPGLAHSSGNATHPGLALAVGSTARVGAGPFLGATAVAGGDLGGGLTAPSLGRDLGQGPPIPQAGASPRPGLVPPPGGGPASTWGHGEAEARRSQARGRWVGPGHAAHPGLAVLHATCRAGWKGEEGALASPRTRRGGWSGCRTVAGLGTVQQTTDPKGRLEAQDWPLAARALALWGQVLPEAGPGMVREPPGLQPIGEGRGGAGWPGQPSETRKRNRM